MKQSAVLIVLNFSVRQYDQEWSDNTILPRQPTGHILYVIVWTGIGELIGPLKDIFGLSADGIRLGA